MNVSDIGNEEIKIYEMIENAKDLTKEFIEDELSSLNILKKEIDLVLLKTVQNLYYIIKSHPINSSPSIINQKLLEPNNLYEYYINLYMIKKSCGELQKVVDGMYDNAKAKNNEDSVNFIEYYKNSRQNFEKVIDFMIGFVQQAIKISELGATKRAKLYLKNVLSDSAKMSKSLSDMTEYFDDFEDYSDTYKILFDETKCFFDDSLIVVAEFYEQYTDRGKRVKEELKTNKITDQEVNVLKTAPNQMELDRVEAINKANDLFDRLCIDFMRDLEKEVSLMNRDMYEELINKFEKFTKKFPMPLSNDVSLGMANEAYMQIEKMINSVYEISRNTYTPVVFGG